MVNLTQLNWTIKSRRRMTKTRRTYFILAAECSQEARTYFINVRCPWNKDSVPIIELNAHGEEPISICRDSDLGKLVSRICNLGEKIL
jgi:hypothetical protein